MALTAKQQHLELLTSKPKLNRLSGSNLRAFWPLTSDFKDTSENGFDLTQNKSSFEWKLNSNGNETTNPLFNLTNVGDITFQTVAGKQCVGPFTEGSQYLSGSIDTNTEISKINGFILEFDLYFNTLSAGKQLVFWADSGISNFISINTSNGDDGKRIAFESTNGNTESSFEFSVETWYNIKYSYTNNILKLYINNNVISDFEYSISMPFSDVANLDIGGTPSLYYPAFDNGYIANVKLYTPEITFGTRLRKQCTENFPAIDSRLSFSQVLLDEIANYTSYSIEMEVWLDNNSLDEEPQMWAWNTYGTGGSEDIEGYFLENDNSSYIGVVYYQELNVENEEDITFPSDYRNSWHKYLFTQDETNQKVYIDGKLVSDVAIAYNSFTPTGGWIGNWAGDDSGQYEYGATTCCFRNVKLYNTVIEPDNSLVAEWKGNSSDWLTDSTEHKNDLTLNGSVMHLPQPSVPEGDRWLGKLTTDEYTNYFQTPATSTPENSQGFISFYLRINLAEGETSDYDNSPLIYDYHSSDSSRFFRIFSSEEYFDIYKNKLWFEWTDSDGNDLILSFNNGITIFDGLTHKIAITWKENIIKLYVDEILDTIINSDVDFGTKTEDDVTMFESWNTPSSLRQVWIDDFTISSELYTVPTALPTPPTGYYIAHYKGNSDGQLLDATGNGNDLTMVGQVSNSDVPGMPEGDRWLAQWNGSEDQANNYYNIPLTARPQSKEGFISFYLKVDQSVDKLYTDFVGFDTGGNDDDTRKFFYLYKGDDTDLSFAYITANDEFANFSIAAENLYDNNTHLVVVSWDKEGLKIYIDNILIYSNAYTPDFGTSSFINTNAGYNLFGINLEADGNGVFFMDDFIISGTKAIIPQPEVAFFGFQFTGTDSIGSVERGNTPKPYAYFDEAGREYEGGRGRADQSVTPTDINSPDSQTNKVKNIPNVNKRFIR